MRSILFPMLLVFQSLLGQENTTLQGKVVDHLTHKPIIHTRVELLNGTMGSYPVDPAGNFAFQTTLEVQQVLVISAEGYLEQRLPVTLEGGTVDLGTLLLVQDLEEEAQDNLVNLTDAEISEEETVSLSTGLLQATRDVFLNKAAFNFGQVFFRVRGYDSREGQVQLNGIPMNKLMDGRPQWNNWGGLNDVLRNQELSNGLEASNKGFGGLLGLTHIDTRPSGLRPGLRLSSSASNRTYSGRVMATYNSGKRAKGLNYAISASRRWAEEGFIEGTLYDAFSGFGVVEYAWNDHNSLQVAGLWAYNRRGSSSALTEEVATLQGTRYNPYWGMQDGDIRNSRDRIISEPMVMANYKHTGTRVTLDLGVLYQWGMRAKGRLGYYNAPNPDPTYYRYLPSYYLNSSIGANYESAQTARAGFLAEPQLQWASVYAANRSAENDGRGVYVQYDDRVDDKQLTWSGKAGWKWGGHMEFDAGLVQAKLTSENYGLLQDLLGANFHVDQDPFSGTANDVDGALEKRQGDRINYNYRMEIGQTLAFVQWQYSGNRWEAFLAGSWERNIYQRTGLFKNERYLDSSFGPGESLEFSGHTVKAGVQYRLSGRHWVSAHALQGLRAPLPQNTYINPRENQSTIPEISLEKVSSADVNYIIRLPKLTGRITGFYTRFMEGTDINYFFVDGGLGSDFVQETLTDLDCLHMGVEMGLEYDLGNGFKLNAAANVAKYLYASDPRVAINFDTAGAEEDFINPSGFQDLGIARVKDLKLAQGPQKALALGIEYRDPKYWWVGATASYLANNYTSISMIPHTQSFYLDPETGSAFPNIDQEKVASLLEQKPLESVYVLDLIGGKSWIWKGHYISVFASVNNAFDAVFKTGGYEQSRNGNYGQYRQDNLSGQPSFGPKYWYGYGRTYFLNLAISL